MLNIPHSAMLECRGTVKRFLPTRAWHGARTWLEPSLSAIQSAGKRLPTATDHRTPAKPASQRAFAFISMLI